ncbi:hypothetical protein SDC9_122673 [bioreactor metagenome]|uniref:Uncharacterized protein n=1 Tax=bioreactor metagenome TaxID=1076179 RepID=A0A645CFC4_9ZZZZ
MNVLADLGAGADSGPSIDHGTFIDVGADVDEGGHQYGVLGDERTFAGEGTGHDTEAAGLELLFGPPLELGIDLVVEADVAGFLDAVVAGAEGEQNGLLGPLVDHPFAIDLLGDTQLAAVEIADHGFDDLDRVGRLGRQLGTLFPEFVDGGLQRMAHVKFSLGYSCCANWRMRWVASRHSASEATSAMRMKLAPGLTPCDSRARKLPGRTTTL